MPETWPTALPNPTVNFSGSKTSNVIRTEMEGGLTRQRRRYTASVRAYPVTWEFTNRELWLFEGFVEHRLAGGSLAFLINLPVGGDTGDPALKQQSARILSGEYSVTHDGFMHWVVSATLEVDAATVMTPAQADALWPPA